MTTDGMETTTAGRPGPKGGKLPPGVECRGRKLWVRFSVNGKEYREPVPADVGSPRAAARYRSERIAEYTHGQAAPDGRQLRVRDLLAAVLTEYEKNKRASLPTARGRVRAIDDAIGDMRAQDVTADVIDRLQVRWQRAGMGNATINRHADLLRRGFRLMVRARKLAVVPYVERLREDSPRGRYIGPAEADAIGTHLPDYLQPFFRFARLYGTRRGQLARTQRRFVDLVRGVVEWPAAECKAGTPHAIPLEGDGLVIVEAAMADARTWCPYLFHGPRCAPGRTSSVRWGCVGDFKKAWATACKAAGFPIGRKAGGFTFHHTRNSAATDLAAAGLTIEDVMTVGGWKTAAVARRYNLGNLDALRARVAASRDPLGKVVQLAPRRRA
jgi:integrase